MFGGGGGGGGGVVVVVVVAVLEHNRCAVHVLDPVSACVGLRFKSAENAGRRIAARAGCNRPQKGVLIAIAGGGPPIELCAVPQRLGVGATSAPARVAHCLVRALPSSQQCERHVCGVGPLCRQGVYCNIAYLPWY